MKVLKEKRYKGKPRKSKQHKIHIYIQIHKKRNYSTSNTGNKVDRYVRVYWILSMQIVIYMMRERLVGWLGFNGTLSMQVVAI